MNNAAESRSATARGLPSLQVGLRPAIAADVEWIAELRAVVLRADLERLERYDDIRVRQRFRDAFDLTDTRVIVVNGDDVGSVAIRADGDARWLEHFYISASHQGRGVGGRILTRVLDDAVVYRLNVLRGSPARALYERHGFAVEQQDEVDVFMSLDRTAPVIGESAGR